MTNDLAKDRVRGDDGRVSSGAGKVPPLPGLLGQVPMDIASYFKVQVPNELSHPETITQSALESLRDALDTPELRDAHLIAKSFHYREMLEDVVSYSAQKQESKLSCPHLLFYYQLRGILLELIGAKENPLQQAMVEKVHTWYKTKRSNKSTRELIAPQTLDINRSRSKLHQDEESDSEKEDVEWVVDSTKENGTFPGAGRVLERRFHDYSHEQMRYSGLESLENIKTRDLFHSHAKRLQRSKSELVVSARKRLYEPTSQLKSLQHCFSRPNLVSPFVFTPEPQHSDLPLFFQEESLASAQSDLTKIWVKKRRQEAVKRKFHSERHQILSRWAEQRARFEERITQKQEAILLDRFHKRNELQAVLPRTRTHKLRQIEENHYTYAHGFSLKYKQVEQEQTEEESPAPALECKRQEWKGAPNEKTKQEEKKTSPALNALASVPAWSWQLAPRSTRENETETEADTKASNSTSTFALDLVRTRPGSTRVLFKPEDELSTGLSPYAALSKKASKSIGSLFHSTTNRILASTVSTCASRRTDLMHVDRIKDVMKSKGVRIARGTLENALVLPRAGLTQAEKLSLFPDQCEGLMMHPFAKEGAKKKGKGKGKGAKKGGKKKGGKKKKK